MAWTEPTTENIAGTKVTIDIFDEIAGNQVYLKERADAVDNNLGQAVNTDSDVEFNSITTDNVAIKHKYFSGNLDSNGDVTIAHGLSEANIIGISSSMYNSSTSTWFCNSFTLVNGTAANTQVTFDSTSVYLSGGDDYESQPYRVLVTYQA